jgi:glutathione synthase/RimK-type ligase-like ATP-grasp enzyme
MSSTRGAGRADERPIGILYEHPEWFKLLFAELERRGLPFERLYVDEHWFDPAERESRYRLVVNRVSPSSYLRGHAGSILYARQYLAHLREIGAPVVNGYDAYTLETSKALQLLLFERLGVRYPRARVVNHPSQLVAAAHGLTYPVIVKPNVGGSGALMRRFESPEELRAAVEAATRGDESALDFGIDRTALVQEYLSPAEGSIVRVEVLDGQLLYAIKIRTNPDEGFNLCPADICQVPAPGAPVPAAPGTGAASPLAMPASGSNGAAALAADSNGGGAIVEGEACDFGAAAVAMVKKPLQIEAYAPPREVAEDAIRLVKAGGLDVGGVEYLVSARDGLPYFYDVNALSNFVTDAVNVVGFDPTDRFVDFLERRAGVRQPVGA